MPAGYGKVCEICYYRGLLGKRVEMDCAGFASSEIIRLFREYGCWLEAEVGVQKAAISVHRYQQFFAEVDTQWGTVPKYKVLLARYGTLGLRRRELPMRFLVKTGRVEVDAVAKTEEATQRQIFVLLKSFSATSRARALLTGYHNHLQKRLKAGKTSLHSIRLALTPAVEMLKEAHVDGDRIPNQSDLDKYLNRAPGQRAAISGFVGFLKKSGAAELNLLPKMSKGKMQRRAKQALEHELIALLTTGGSGKVHARKLIGVALAYFHGLPELAVRKSRSINADVDTDRSGVTLQIRGIGYWLPTEFIKSAVSVSRASAGV